MYSTMNIRWQSVQQIIKPKPHKNFISNKENWTIYVRKILRLDNNNLLERVYKLYKFKIKDSGKIFWF